MLAPTRGAVRSRIRLPTVSTRAPAGLDDRGRDAVEDQRGAVDAVPDGEAFAREDRRVVPRAGHVDGGGRERGRGCVRERNQRGVDRRAPGDSFRDDPVGDQRCFAGEPELRDVRGVEGGDHRSRVIEIEFDRVIGLAAAQMHAAFDPHVVHRDTLRH